MGGRKPQTPQIVQPPPPTITQLPSPQANFGPAVQQNAADLYAAQLKYNPELTAQAAQLQQQYGPQLAQSQADIQGRIGPQLTQQEFALQQQYGPMYRALYEQMFPTQTQGLETLSRQALQRLQSPQSLTPEQQSAQDVVRQRAQNELVRGIREQANVGGTLYGGRAQERETRALAELQNQYALSDIGLQQQQRQQALQELIASGQVIFPQVQQPGMPQAQVAQFGQGVTPNPDALLAAIMQGQFVQPAAIGFPQAQPGFWSGAGQGASAAATTALLMKLLASSGGCHVAEVLYGLNDMRTILARFYVLTHENGFLRVYRRHSQTWATWVKRWPLLKRIIQPLWDRMWQKELSECQL